MAHLERRIAPALLASLVATLVTVAARAETPAAAATSDCLAKPGGTSAKGSHWYYRIDRASGRHCWYQHAIVDAPQAAKADAPAKRVVAHPHPHRHAAAAPSVPAPDAAPVYPPPVPEAQSAPAAETADISNSVMPPVASPPPAARVNSPIDWPAPVAVTTVPATPPAMAQVDRVPARSIETPPPPSPEPKAEALQPQLDTAPPPHQPARTSAAARGEEFAGPSSHVPALLGAVSALAIIIIGSFAGRLLTKRPPGRQQLKTRSRDWQDPVSGMEEEDAPGIVPTMPNGRDVAHERPGTGMDALASPDGWGLRHSSAPRRATPVKAASAARPARESTRVLEDNVRDLLHRLQSDLRGRPAEPAPAAPPAPAKAPHVPSAQELDAVLAIWRAKRSG